MTDQFTLARLGDAGSEVPVVRVGDRTFDARPVTADFDGAFFAADGVARIAAALGELPELDAAEVAGLRIGAPIAAPGKVVCIGLNYRDHAEETGAALPAEPVIFMKDPSTVVGPFDDVLIPRNSTKTDWEVELGVVIGTTARYLASPDEALAHVAGYAVSHDVSEREFQLERGGQWDKGKSCETFNPLGPVLVPADDVADPQALGLRLWVNGTPRQDGSTANMLFSVAHVIWYLSQFMVLRPGDLINTGTPAGVALGIEGNPYLRAGDTVELEIDGLGRASQKLVQA
ncbi:2-keto-4-pentenoate hydratase/2-oxohepta-3-ene-1,7-dioic acid hydratase (catechol pathway) [Agromyces sp. CF514]|uniref:fumarylacetoacetate hydrolase family protein n=1 Tax=Agromyces sp. CF514 TaxID=1881031 RepID=UPI0008DEFCCB|nr:fumarylacetoacetate hydrolase family protein [Agromyces sp. CF514]SFR70790.1 2-keto-4-pentenoate hydratase/2-oxohepta-3-ene-1,7-dioic acid hydratase (catechol pathway) [Agromyces sp. CF514]